MQLHWNQFHQQKLNDAEQDNNTFHADNQAIVGDGYLIDPGQVINAWNVHPAELIAEWLPVVLILSNKLSKKKLK